MFGAGEFSLTAATKISESFIFKSFSANPNSDSYINARLLELTT